MLNKRKIYRSVIAVVTALLLLFCSSCGKKEPDSQAYAYLEVFKSVTDDIANSKIKCIVVNLTNVLHEHPIYIQKLIEDYAKEYGVKILWNVNREKYVPSENSYLIIFEDIELTETHLKTDMTRWSAPLAAAGFIYTAEKEDGNWTITDYEFTWIS